MALDLTQQVNNEGFGPWLKGIVPDDIAASSGAFSASMQQIKNILQVDFEKFSQVVASLETTKNLNQINGTSVPVDIDLAQIALDLTALGSGPNGTYTMSDFFGSMSGIPYMWSDIQAGLQQLGLPNLRTIYNNLYLAVKWEQATATWDGSNFTYTNRGGGYGRGGASAPTVTVGGNPATAIIGIDPNDLSTYGKIVSISYSGPAGVVVIDPPPGPNPAGATNAAYNAVVQGYINDANTQIALIRTVFPFLSVRLNTIYDSAGKQLTIEQRSRYTGIPPVPTVTRDKWLNLYPTSLYIFVDSIPQIAIDIAPHMSAQTLEAISNFNLPGGQSVVGMMRQERNAARLREIGVDLDNNIDDTIDPEFEAILISNGTLPAKPGTGIQFPDLEELTNPASLFNVVDDEILTTAPPGYTDPETGDFLSTLEVTLTESPVAKINDPNTGRNVIQPSNNPTNTPILVGPRTPTGPVTRPKTVITNLNPIRPVIDPVGRPNNGRRIITPQRPTPFIPPTVLPSTYTVQEAIDKVIECNCDCWVN